MPRRERDGPSILGDLAAAVDADAGARLYADRGDGVMELVAMAGPTPLHGGYDGSRSGIGTPRERGRWRWRRMALSARVPASATNGPMTLAHDGVSSIVALPGDRGGILVLSRRRAEPFSEADLAVARLEARSMAGRVHTRLAPRRRSWSSQMEAVQSVAAQLTRLTTVQAISAALCTQTRRVVAFDNARVYVVAADGVTLDAVAFRPHAPEYQGESADSLRSRVGEGITGWVAATGQPLIVPDSARDPRAIDVPGSEPVQEESMLLAPLRSDARVIGVVVLSGLGLRRFDEDDLRMLVVLADQAAVAIENAHLLAARERHAAELAALLDISQASAKAADEQELAAVMADRLRVSSGMERCTVYRLDDLSGELRALAGSPPDARVARRDALGDRVTRAVLTGGTARVITADAPVATADDRDQLAALGAAALILLPLATAGRVVGLVELSSRQRPDTPPDGRLSLLRTMANHAATALENARLLAQLRMAAEMDLVSGVSSHRHLQERLRQETARAARTRSPMSLLMLDLDDFKLVNDRYGHQVGDAVLRAVAATLHSAVRTNDVVARYGGDEFVVLMPDTDARQAQQVARRAAEAIFGQGHPMPDGSEARVACSLGVSSYPADGRSGSALLRAADAAMYAQKRARRSSAPDAVGLAVRGRGAPREPIGSTSQSSPLVAVGPEPALSARD